MRDYIQLGIGGLFLEQDAFRRQREASDGLKRGFLLVLIVGVLVGMASMIGQILQTLASRDRAAVNQTIYDSLITMPWYVSLEENTPGFDMIFQERFDQVTQVLDTFEGTSILGGVISFVTTPLSFLAVWLIFGLFLHLLARALGGNGTMSQTLACTALAAGANLLALVQVIPFVQISGVMLLALLANYVALREAHELSPWRAFWAIMIGPLVLVVLLVVVLVVGLVILMGAASG